MRTMLSLAAIALLAGCAPGMPTPHQRADQEALDNARPVGEPISCVPLTGIRETRVRDDRTIDFFMRGGEVYRNTLPNSCPTLGFEESFSYRTSLSQLCAVDIIRVRNRAGVGVEGPACGLGQFQRVEGVAR